MIEAPFRGEPATSERRSAPADQPQGVPRGDALRGGVQPRPRRDRRGHRRRRRAGDRRRDDASRSTASGSCARCASWARAPRRPRPAEQACALRGRDVRRRTRATSRSRCSTCSTTTGKRRRLARQRRLRGRRRRRAPAEVDLGADGQAPAWPLGAALARGHAGGARRRSRRAGPAAARAAGRSRRARAIVAAARLARAGAGLRRAVCGVSPHRASTTGYRTFFELAARAGRHRDRNARAYEEERKRAEALAELDRAKTAFFSNVSHEFRTPLTLMLGPREDALASPGGALERRGAGDRPPQRAAPAEAGQHAARLLAHRGRARAGDATSRPTCGADPGSRQRVPLGDRARRACASRSTARRCAEPVYVDRDMWEKIVLNLLSNAFKFTFEGDIAVALRAAGDQRRADGRGHRRRHPRGRAAARLRALPPHRGRAGAHPRGLGHRPRAGARAGRGCTAATSRVASAVGRGTTFTVSLPLGAAHLPRRIGVARAPLAERRRRGRAVRQEALRWLRPRAGDRRREPAGAGGRAPSAARVLVADDNADMRDYLARLLRPQWTVEAVADGAQALARRARSAARSGPHRRDDARPRRLRAAARAARRRRARRHVPVIMLSARAGEESRVEGLAGRRRRLPGQAVLARELLARVARTSQRRACGGRREAERAEQLTSLFEQAPVAIVLPARAGARRSSSPTRGCQALVGRPGRHRQAAAARRCPELREPGRSARCSTACCDTGEPRRGPGERRCSLDDGDGEPSDELLRPSSTSRCATSDGAGRGHPRRGVPTVTGEVRARPRARGAARERPRPPNRAKDEFLAMLGHELRNPLAPILTALQLMRMRGTARRASRHVIERQVEHLVRLVDDLLDVSRITRGKVELSKERARAGRGRRCAALEMASPLLEQRRQRVDLDVPRRGAAGRRRSGSARAGGLQPAHQRRQVQRAGRHHPRRRRDARAGASVLRVRDQGIGIAPDMLRARSSTCSCRSRRRSTARRAASASAWRSCAAWSSCTAATVRRAATGLGQGSEFIVDLPLAPRRERLPTLDVPRWLSPDRRGAVPASRAASSSSTTTRTPPRASPRCWRARAPGRRSRTTARPRWPSRRPSSRTSACSTSGCRSWTATSWPQRLRESKRPARRRAHHRDHRLRPGRRPRSARTRRASTPTWSSR